MKGKRTPRNTAQAKKFIQDYHHDYLQKQKISDDQRKAWNRKPYYYGSNR